MDQLPAAPEDEIDFLRNGGSEALAALFSRYQKRLERMVALRLDRRLYARVDAADVLQEAYLEISRRIDDYLAKEPATFFVWIRQITWQILLMTHRRHLGAQRRSAGQEVSLRWTGPDGGTSVSLAGFLVAHLTSPSQAVIREERYAQLRDALDQMDPLDREVLALRHFEHLGNSEVAEVLDIQPTAASNRYVRALKRLKQMLESMPEIRGEDR
ncbi:RNA polymerase sigma factor [Planctomycetes bacterium Pan216]|uniref:RNA polymerase sigma factor n=1 Tax=Kolteria novifilia TaxID=2527975 RepID=A0A518B4M3_9BACT|nr:RNA polymerase sigma factor [Planctomycetes bacterium Pan216]